MIELAINGTPYTGFLSISTTRALSTLANDFTLTASSSGEYPALQEGDRAEVFVDGVLVCTGYIEDVSGTESEGNHTVTYSGRDNTADFLDSTLDQLDDIRASNSLTLKKLIELVLEHLGLNIPVIGAFSPPPFNEAEDIITPEVGQSAFDFIIQYARKRQALLTSTGKGEILITQSSPEDSDAVVQALNGANDNNVLSQNWSRRSSEKFRRYVRRGQADPRALNFTGGSDSKTVEDQSGITEDRNIRTGRQQVVVESGGYSSEQLADRSKWAKQQAEAAAVRFSCVVQGHTDTTGEVWDVNLLAQVNSTAADISRKMLIDSVTFSQGEGRATQSALQFVERDVYTISEQVLGQRPAGRLNDAFTALG